MKVPHRRIPMVGDNRVLDVATLSKDAFMPALLYRIHPWFWSFVLLGLPWPGRLHVYRLRAYNFRRVDTGEVESVWMYVRDGEVKETPEKIDIAQRVLDGAPVFGLLHA